MGIKDKYFDPNWYYYKVIMLCVFVCIDILMNSFTQFLNFGNEITDTVYTTNCGKDNADVCYAILFLQLCVQVLMIFTLLSIFSQTFYFKQGILGAICGKFIWTFIIIFLYPIIFLVERFIRVGLLYKKIKDIEPGQTVNPTDYKDDLTNITIWYEWYYIIFYVLKYICAFLFYIGQLNTSYELGKAKYYKFGAAFSTNY